ncbi:CorA family divalent cation transporter [Nocardioides convexus]|uniref:CorA family divalent cation transporter n=1 Tax=Nocardioides convexus TaxID=2712224 RepID=UPI00241849AC|nr:CorA family divalent cation transporter [Nocardioides convexus]
MRRFATGSVDLIEAEAGPFFRDVSDHLSQAADEIDTLDGLLSTAFDAHLARLGVQQNDDMRKISAGAALVVVPTLIAGVYGMNFTHMPEPGVDLRLPVRAAAHDRHGRGAVGAVQAVRLVLRPASGRHPTMQNRQGDEAGQGVERPGYPQHLRHSVQVLRAASSRALRT